MIIERSLRPVYEDREVGHLQPKLKGLGTYGTVGLEFGLSVLFGLFAGQWLDRKLHTDPWLTFVGMGFGTAAGIRALWRAASMARKELEDEERREAELRRDYHERNRKK
jgi:F0F1-type ATP synthase assembly protein I